MPLKKWMNHWMKWFPGKHEDLNSDPQHSHKKLVAEVACPVIWGRDRATLGQGAMADETSWLGQFWVQRFCHSQQGGTEADTRCKPLASTHMHTNAPVPTWGSHPHPHPAPTHTIYTLHKTKQKNEKKKPRKKQNPKLWISDWISIKFVHNIKYFLKIPLEK